jgi:hypothetical protein
MLLTEKRTPDFLSSNPDDRQSMLNSISENSGRQLSNLLLTACNGLADRTEVCAPLPKNDSLDWGSATDTGLCGALINPEIILEIAAPVNPIDAGTVPLNPFAQNPADTGPEHSGLFLGKRARKAQRMKLSQKQGFISIDIPNASQKILIQQEWLQLAALVLEALVEFLRAELLIQRLGTQLAKNRLRVGREPDPPEFAWIIEG